ncbi:hypothetical protein SODALDRAFT_363776 [Sodiomyces alkalinus F11]|uniref:Uncharacterized protein n=1 Tax=Sodiomyces alkalinus (strain CBS 110278 / VKM F-3762 / F11) TaxID=1314773 RepID=A0A3N2PKZ3_SODAK|nr:hypothetical protein SODALDRAFT_363776 [Sodiomyces alkalinus F11]ROT35084.1 hypothetical protein SODALDRAFT_363776 [Sodiomyces alkalinus F11]
MRVRQTGILGSILHFNVVWGTQWLVIGGKVGWSPFNRLEIEWAFEFEPVAMPYTPTCARQMPVALQKLLEPHVDRNFSVLALLYVDLVWEFEDLDRQLPMIYEYMVLLVARDLLPSYLAIIHPAISVTRPVHWMKWIDLGRGRVGQVGWLALPASYIAAAPAPRPLYSVVSTVYPPALPLKSDGLSAQYGALHFLSCPLPTAPPLRCLLYY